MGILDSFERGLERVVEGTFAKTFKSGVQPVEVAAALRRELDTKASIVSRDRILVPNRLVVRLAPRDHERLAGIGPALTDELTQLVERHATTQRYSFAGPLQISLRPDERLSVGMLDIDSETAQGEVSWIPVLEVNGTRHEISRGRTILGRGSEADVTIDDPGASRKHVEILWDGERGQAADLGSTNGSRLNGEPLSKAPLPPDSEIEIGRTRIVFRVLAQASDASRTAQR